MTRHRLAQIAEKVNPKSPENRHQTRRFLRNRLLHARRLPARLNRLAILHGRLSRRKRPDELFLHCNERLRTDGHLEGRRGTSPSYSFHEEMDLGSRK
jgi:hypothetical protein